MNANTAYHDIAQVWKQIKGIYTSTHEDVRGRIKHERNVWMKEETWKPVEERGDLKGKIEIARTRNQKMTAAHIYHKMNCEVKRSCRREKRDRIDRIVREAEKAAEVDDTKKV